MSAPRAPYLPTPRPGWKLVPLRRLGDTASGSGFPPSLQGQSGHEIAFYKVKHLGAADRDGVLPQPDDTIDRATADELHATVFPAGTFVYAKVGAALMLGRVRSLPRPACIDNNMAGLVPRADVDWRFLFWAITRVKFDFLVNPGAVPSLSDRNLLAYPILVPPRDEQRAIADYLDHETAQIDALITKQEQLIATLRERRRGLIASTVLGGQDPLHPTETFTAVGAEFDVALGKMLDAGKSRREGDIKLPYVRAANIQDSGLNLGDVKSMPYSPAEADSLDLRAGDLLVVEGGAVGTCTVLEEDMPGWSFQKTVNRVRPRASSSGSWLAYVLRTYRDAGVIDIVCNRSTIPHLTAEKLRALRIPSTPVDRQREIVEYLDEATAKIDVLIAKAERFIELSTERRAALITAAVTGQIDVRVSA